MTTNSVNLAQAIQDLKDQNTAEASAVQAVIGELSQHVSTIESQVADNGQPMDVTVIQQTVSDMKARITALNAALGNANAPTSAATEVVTTGAEDNSNSETVAYQNKNDENGEVQ